MTPLFAIVVLLLLAAGILADHAEHAAGGGWLAWIESAGAA